MDIDDLRSKFWSALEDAVGRDLSLKERITDALEDHVFPIHPSDVPDAYRDEVAKLRALLEVASTTEEFQRVSAQMLETFASLTEDPMAIRHAFSVSSRPPDDEFDEIQGSADDTYRLPQTTRAALYNVEEAAIARGRLEGADHSPEALRAADAKVQRALMDFYGFSSSLQATAVRRKRGD